MTATSGVVHFGSLATAFDFDDDLLAAGLALRFRAGLDPVWRGRPDLRVTVITAPGRRSRVESLSEPLRESTDGTRRLFETSSMTMTVDDHTTPTTATVTAWPESQDVRWMEHYFAVFVEKLLLVQGAARLHGAAIDFAGTTNLFLGDKGAGKSTVSLHLGRAGGVVLADDQLVARRVDGRVLVSGCDSRIRLTERSERHFLTEPIDVEPADFGGVVKKELELASLVATAPHTDHAVGRIFFSGVGTAFAVEPVPRREAVTRILATLAPSHRFTGPADQLRLLDIVTGLVEDAETAEVTLSPDLSELELVTDLLR